MVEAVISFVLVALSFFGFVLGARYLLRHADAPTRYGYPVEVWDRPSSERAPSSAAPLRWEGDDS